MKEIPDQLLVPMGDPPGHAVIGGTCNSGSFGAEPSLFRIAYVGDDPEAVLLDEGEARRLIELLTEWLAG